MKVETKIGPLKPTLGERTAHARRRVLAACGYLTAVVLDASATGRDIDAARELVSESAARLQLLKLNRDGCGNACPRCGSQDLKDKGTFDKCMTCSLRFGGMADVDDEGHQFRRVYLESEP